MKQQSFQPFFIAHSGLLAAVADTCGWWLYGQARKDLTLHKHSVFVSRGKYGFGWRRLWQLTFGVYAVAIKIKNDMTKETLLYKLTGTDTPRFLTEREQKIVDTCLQLINETEQLHKPIVSGALFAFMKWHRENNNAVWAGLEREINRYLANNDR